MEKLPSIILAFALSTLASCGGSSGGSGDTDPGPGPGTPQAVTRGPQIGLLAETSVLVAWRSVHDAVGSIEYGETSGVLIEVLEAAPTTEHVFILDGLTPGMTYEYRIRLDGEVESDGHGFTTVPADPEAPFRFVAFGDSGDDTPGQRDVAARVVEAAPELVLVTGDVIYERGAEHELDPSYFVPYAHLIDHIPFYPALGNHDVVTQGGQPLLKALYLPRNDADRSERFYSFDRGSVHFVALDSTTDLRPGSVQHEWLRDDLQDLQDLQVVAPDAPRWVVLYFHHPPYSSSLHGSDIGMRTSLAPVLASFHVDLVLNGHDHNYERTFPILDGAVADADQEPQYANTDGTIFIVTGGGGRRLYRNGWSPFTAYSESVHHHVEVDVDGDIDTDVLTVRAVRDDGSVLDQVWLEKRR